MGMSSSQARLLTLTARMHDIEYKAQRIEAQKLQLANDSRRAYEDYLVALDAKKVQYRSINSDGSVTFIDATLARLENGAVPGYTGLKSNKSFLIKNADTNEVYVTREFANAYGITEGEAPSAGELDDYLESHGAHKREIMRTETDYSNITSVNPVDNKVISTPYTETVTDPSTYSITSGGITPASAVDHSSSTNYNLNGTFKNPVDKSETVGLTKDIVDASVTPSGVLNVNTVEGTPVVDKDEFFIAKQNFRTKKDAFVKFDTADLNLTIDELNTKYNLEIDFNDPTKLSLKIQTSNESYLSGSYNLTKTNPTVNKDFTYSKTTVFKDLLNQIAGECSTITFNESTATLSTNNKYLYASDPYYFATKMFNNKVDYNYNSSSQTFSLSTKMFDYMDSEFKPTYGDITLKDPTNQTVERSMFYRPTSGVTTTPPANFTYADYFQFIQDAIGAENCSWMEDAEGVHFYAKNGYHFTGAWGGSLITSNIHHTTKTNNITVDLNLTGLAEDVYLARSIVAEKTPAEYSADHNSSITSILSELSSAYGGYSTSENKRQVTLFTELLQDALSNYNSSNPKNPSVLTTALSKLGTTITSNKYKDEVLTDTEGETEKNEVVYNFTNTSATITPGTQTVPDGSSIINKVDTASINDIILKLAYGMYQADNSLGDPNSIASALRTTLTGYGYSNEDISSISNHFSNSSEWNDIISKLVSGQRIDSYTHDFDGYTEVNQASSNALSVSSTTSGVDEHYVSMDSTNDIATRLAGDIYAVNSSINPETVKNQILSNFSTQQLASLSSYYGTSTWNSIVSSLSSSVSPSAVSSYTSKFTSYSDFRPDSSSDLSVSTTPHSHTVDHKGKLNIPTIQGIASNLVVAFRKAGYTVDENEVFNKLNALYGTDDQTNNEKLANINHEAYQYLSGSGSSAIASIYNNLFNGAGLSVPSTYSSSKYDISRANLGTCSASYGTKETPTGKWEWVDDDLYKELVQQWNVLKQFEGNIFVIVDEPLASSYEFVRNLLCETGAFLLEFNKDISNMKETNVAVEVAVREVADEKELKKAEADYEAKLRLIDRKDRNYDTQLAAVESERNATKQEMETLKTVIKDNGERTFKLFS